MIAVIDYDAGNLFSVKNALDYLDIDNITTNNPEDLRKADKLILPGVGALPEAMSKLKATGLVDVIKDEVRNGKPILGICLGMQMLFDRGYEFEETECLGLIRGEVKLMEGPVMEGLKVPHMGWNPVIIENECVLSEGIAEGSSFYYVHSYKVITSMDNVSLYSMYGGVVPGLVFKGNIFGTQFHPEKSGNIGLKLLSNFGKG